MQLDPSALGAIVDRYGLPLAILAGLLWSLYTRRLILGSEKDRSDAAYEKELAYREDRRQEERTGRLASEEALRQMTGALDKLSDGIEANHDAVLAALQGDERRATRR